MPEGGKKKMPEGLGVGGFHTHEPLGGGRKDGTQGGVRGYKASRGGDVSRTFVSTLFHKDAASFFLEKLKNIQNQH